ncbi:PilC/PilY family type IV pilus protein [Granulosicoccus antarcticus]|uniref:PilY1 beta-propeller domain-containing protein n=1 Tax=Granulosicoccus antarcticus IMCC3135 TaxID=1192854 RepID=A0A2Z2NRV7_9GAMM|nr:PilC/PilY family type IV pilus protein [Granulosicoccus antarcticus]ASJ70277.1 hypothetical protein IMCC3135_00755 [Granulosicoccus antarcticus IMCC3135]
MSMTATSTSIRNICLTASLVFCLPAPAQADDIDVYRARIAGQQKPNILFVLDYSGSMAADIYGSYKWNTNPKKIDILKDAMHNVLDNNVDTINAGIGSLYSYTTTGIQWPISELSADASSVDGNILPGLFTVKDIIGQRVDARFAGGGTATVDALVEAAQYFRGDAVTHNDRSPLIGSEHQPATWNSVTGLYTGGNSKAAIAASYSPSDAYSTNTSATYYCNDFSGSGGPNYCESKTLSNCELRSSTDTPTAGSERQTNLWGSYQQCEYEHTRNWMGANYNSPITQTCQANTIVLISDGEPTWINDGDSLRSTIGTDMDGCEDLSLSIFEMPDGMQTEGNCGPEVVRALASSDQMPGILDSAVKTYTVGFNVEGPGQDYLTLLATAGKGKFFKADKPEELNAALDSIIDEVLGGSENFAELSIDVDKASFSHDNRVFYNLFSPSTRSSWKGNLKGYFVDSTGLIDINGDKATAVSEFGEQFSETAQSFWSDDIDGNSVSKGGASEKLADTVRNIYTYTGDDIPSIGVPLAGVAANRLESSNTAISTTLLGLPTSSALRTTSLDWLQDAPMGSSLHSKSVQVDYGTRSMTYVMTNQGLLHAFDTSAPTVLGSGDTSGGEELFAFMPKELISHIPALSQNLNSGNHIYGLDGQITRWHTDTNNDGIVNNGEKLLLILGMRRGGNSYYALNVSTPEAPRLAWSITGESTDFPRLAQSWSRMSLIKVKDGTSERRVLAFAAGYDADAQDSKNTPVASLGNAIYMIDEYGDPVWSVDSSDHASMLYSIASDLSIIDSDYDGLADRLYVGDLGGQLWRVDFDDIDTTPAVTLFATLDDGEHQPIFYAPSIALNSDAAGDYLSISLGSGNRTNPLLAGIQNHLYMIRDTHLDKGVPASDFTTVTPGNLFDATSDDISSTDKDTADDAQEDLLEARGWKISLAPNEKSLSELITFEGTLMATTFEADTTLDTSICGYDTTGRLYQMSLKDAATIDGLGSSSGDADDTVFYRWSDLESAGIPSTPVIVFPKGSSVVQIIVDKEAVNLLEQKLSRVFWHAK